jgi:hypothetical protein
MSSFLCWIWPYLMGVMGGLLGWLASGWLARLALARKPSTIEKGVDRKVDRPLDRIAEEVVDNPVHLAEIASLAATAGLVPGLRAQLDALQAVPPKVVEKIVEKMIPARPASNSVIARSPIGAPAMPRWKRRTNCSRTARPTTCRRRMPRV